MIWASWRASDGQGQAQFSTRTDGSASVDLPGSLDGVRRVMVTDEPQGGSSEPTGKLLLSASTA